MFTSRSLCGRAARRTNLLPDLKEKQMPLTLVTTEGVIPKGSERATLKRLADSFLKCHGLTGNKALTPNVIGELRTVPRDYVLHEDPIAIVEWKTPSFAFASRDAQIAHVEEATNIVHEMSGGKVSNDHIWVNVVHAVDGTWGINGKGYSNAELAAVIAKG
jgi:hypothetical protein